MNIAACSEQVPPGNLWCTSQQAQVGPYKDAQGNHAFQVELHANMK